MAFAYFHETDRGLPCIRVTSDPKRAAFEAGASKVVEISGPAHTRTETADFLPGDISYPRLAGEIERGDPVEAYDFALPAALKAADEMMS